MVRHGIQIIDHRNSFGLVLHIGGHVQPFDRKVNEFIDFVVGRKPLDLDYQDLRRLVNVKLLVDVSMLLTAIAVPLVTA